MLSSPLISSVSAAPQPVSASIWAQPERCLKRGEAKRGAVTRAFLKKLKMLNHSRQATEMVSFSPNLCSGFTILAKPQINCLK